MALTVVRETARPLEAVLADPWALTNLLYDQLTEMRHFEAIERADTRIDMASLTAAAFHHPKGIEQARMRLDRIAKRLPSMSDTKAKGLAILNADRAARGLPPLKEL